MLNVIDDYSSCKFINSYWLNNELLEENKKKGKEFPNNKYEINIEYNNTECKEQDNTKYKKQVGNHNKTTKLKNYSESSRKYYTHRLFDYQKDYQKDYLKDYQKDYQKDYLKDYQKDYQKDYLKDYQKDYIKDYQKDYQKDYLKDYQKDYQKKNSLVKTDIYDRQFTPRIYEYASKNKKSDNLLQDRGVDILIKSFSRNKF